jgi:hypothetical protein
MASALLRPWCARQKPMERFPGPAPLRQKPQARKADPCRIGLPKVRLTLFRLAQPLAAVPRIVSAPAIFGSMRPTLSRSLFQIQKKRSCL